MRKHCRPPFPIRFFPIHWAAEISFVPTRTKWPPPGDRRATSAQAFDSALPQEFRPHGVSNHDLPRHPRPAGPVRGGEGREVEGGSCTHRPRRIGRGVRGWPTTSTGSLRGRWCGRGCWCPMWCRWWRLVGRGSRRGRWRLVRFAGWTAQPKAAHEQRTSWISAGAPCTHPGRQAHPIPSRALLP